MKAALMWAYECAVLSFAATERIAKRLRRFEWFRRG